MGIFNGRNPESSVSSWIKFALLGLIVAIALRGANCEQEPTESQCRPYIEKALKEKILDAGEKSDEEISPRSGEVSAEQEENPPTDEITDSTEDSKPDRTDELKSEEEAEREDGESGENPEGDGTPSQEGEESVEEEGAESREEDKTDGGEGASVEDEKDGNEQKEDATEEKESGEKTEDAEEAESAEGAEKDEAESAEAEAGSKEDDDVTEERENEMESQEEKPGESEEEATEGSERAESAEEAGSAEAPEAERSEEEKAASEDEGTASGEDDKGSKEDEEDAKESKEEKDETAESKRDEDDDGVRSAENETEEDENPSQEEKTEDDGESKEGEPKESEEEKEKDENASREEKNGEESAEGGDSKETIADDGQSEEAKRESGEVQDSKETKEIDESEETEKSAEPTAESEEAGASGEGTTSQEAEKSGEEDEESIPDEEDLTKEVVIPENLRQRDHITKILRLDEDSVEEESVLAKAIDSTLKTLKNLYDNAIKPLEMLYKYRDLSNRHFGDPEIFSKPLVLFMGPWSGGKSSTINYLLDIEFSRMALRTGAEPSPAYFNILMHGKDEEILDGTQLAADWTFSGLQKFGQGLLDRLRGVKLNNRLLEKVNIVEIPGILEIRKQVQRLFPFNDACQWFIDRADIIFLVYDPAKLDVGPETEAILDQLKGREYQTRIILNKADQVKPEELMRVQGTLIWNISPLMSSTEPPIMYTTSLWSLPYEVGAPTRLLLAQERAFLRDLREAVDKRVENKIASARRFAVRVRNHAKMVDCYLTTYYNHKTFFGNRKKISDDIIENPQKYHIYEGLSTLTNISRYDLPDPDVYRDFFKINPLYDFTKLSDTCTYFRGCPINKLDVAIAYDLPELVGKYKKAAEAAKEQTQKTNS